MIATPPQSTKKTDHALIMRRIAAYLVDTTLLMLLVQGAQWGIWAATDGFLANHLLQLNNGWLIYGWALLTISLPIWLYFVLQERTARQATLGKQLLGLQVASSTGHAATTSQLFGRTLLKLLPWEFFHLTFMLPTPLLTDPNPGFRPGILMGWVMLLLYGLMMFYTPSQQSIHDLIAKTVVKKRPLGQHTN